jgi:hypothetical protein
MEVKGKKGILELKKMGLWLNVGPEGSLLA